MGSRASCAWKAPSWASCSCSPGSACFSGACAIPAGIAASPDPAILPVFLAAIAVNVRTAIEVLVVYSLVTIVAIVVLSLAAVWGGYQVKWVWLEHHANHVTAAVLVALGIAAWMAF